MDERIRRAIGQKRPLEIRYKRAVRLAEPHDYGIIDGAERLLLFQQCGPDSGKGAIGWRLLDVVNLESYVITDQSFAGSRGQITQPHQAAVEYSLTSLGQSLCSPLDALRKWSEDNAAAVDEARRRFDAVGVQTGRRAS